MIDIRRNALLRGDTEAPQLRSSPLVRHTRQDETENTRDTPISKRRRSVPPSSIRIAGGGLVPRVSDSFHLQHDPLEGTTRHHQDPIEARAQISSDRPRWSTVRSSHPPQEHSTQHATQTRGQQQQDRLPPQASEDRQSFKPFAEQHPFWLSESRPAFTEDTPSPPTHHHAALPSYLQNSQSASHFKSFKLPVGKRLTLPITTSSRHTLPKKRSVSSGNILPPVKSIFKTPKKAGAQGTATVRPVTDPSPLTGQILSDLRKQAEQQAKKTQSKSKRSGRPKKIDNAPLQVEPVDLNGPEYGQWENGKWIPDESQVPAPDPAKQVPESTTKEVNPVPVSDHSLPSHDPTVTPQQADSLRASSSWDIPASLRQSNRSVEPSDTPIVSLPARQPRPDDDIIPPPSFVVHPSLQTAASRSVVSQARPLTSSVIPPPRRETPLFLEVDSSHEDGAANENVHLRPSLPGRRSPNGHTSTGNPQARASVGSGAGVRALRASRSARSEKTYSKRLPKVYHSPRIASQLDDGVNFNDDIIKEHKRSSKRSRSTVNDQASTDVRLDTQRQPLSEIRGDVSYQQSQWSVPERFEPSEGGEFEMFEGAGAYNGEEVDEWEDFRDRGTPDGSDRFDDRYGTQEVIRERYPPTYSYDDERHDRDRDRQYQPYRSRSHSSDGDESPSPQGPLDRYDPTTLRPLTERFVIHPDHKFRAGPTESPELPARRLTFEEWTEAQRRDRDRKRKRIREAARHRRSWDHKHRHYRYEHGDDSDYDDQQHYAHRRADRHRHEHQRYGRPLGSGHHHSDGPSRRWIDGDSSGESEAPRLRLSRHDSCGPRLSQYVEKVTRSRSDSDRKRSRHTTHPTPRHAPRLNDENLAPTGPVTYPFNRRARPTRAVLAAQQVPSQFLKPIDTVTFDEAKELFLEKNRMETHPIDKNLLSAVEKQRRREGIDALARATRRSRPTLRKNKGTGERSKVHENALVLKKLKDIFDPDEGSNSGTETEGDQGRRRSDGVLVRQSQDAITQFTGSSPDRPHRRTAPSTRAPPPKRVRIPQLKFTKRPETPPPKRRRRNADVGAPNDNPQTPRPGAKDRTPSQVEDTPFALGSGSHVPPEPVPASPVEGLLRPLTRARAKQREQGQEGRAIESATRSKRLGRSPGESSSEVQEHSLDGPRRSPSPEEVGEPQQEEFPFVPSQQEILPSDFSGAASHSRAHSTRTSRRPTLQGGLTGQEISNKGDEIMLKTLQALQQSARAQSQRQTPGGSSSHSTGGSREAKNQERAKRIKAKRKAEAEAGQDGRAASRQSDKQLGQGETLMDKLRPNPATSEEEPKDDTALFPQVQPGKVRYGPSGIFRNGTPGRYSFNQRKVPENPQGQDTSPLRPLVGHGTAPVGANQHVTPGHGPNQIMVAQSQAGPITDRIGLPKNEFTKTLEKSIAKVPSLDRYHDDVSENDGDDLANQNIHNDTRFALYIHPLETTITEKLRRSLSRTPQHQTPSRALGSRQLTRSKSFVNQFKPPSKVPGNQDQRATTTATLHPHRQTQLKGEQGQQEDTNATQGVKDILSEDHVGDDDHHQHDKQNQGQGAEERNDPFPQLFEDDDNTNFPGIRMGVRSVQKGLDHFLGFAPSPTQKNQED